MEKLSILKGAIEASAEEVGPVTILRSSKGRDFLLDHYKNELGNHFLFEKVLQVEGEEKYQDVLRFSTDQEDSTLLKVVEAWEKLTGEELSLEDSLF